jgi:dTDP-glucose pyrophosphorylase
MSYRVCIPCAGTGSRLGELTHFINKSLVSIANRPTLAHLIEQFPTDAEFVIALGHKGHLVREFLTLAYPERQFFFAEVAPFEGPGSGLGLSLQTCKQHLQQPFVFISCDTLVEESIPGPDQNWMGYAEVANLDAYRTIAVTSSGVSAIAEKGEGQAPTHKAYVGLAGIHDFQQFWAAMAQGGQTAMETGEAHGMRSLLPNSIQARAFTWHDTGNPDSLAQTRQHYREPDEPNILEKANEAIWFVGDTVIKFSDDKKFIANRVKRVQQLQGFVPEVTGAETHMYRYPKVQGKVLSEVITRPLFDRLLEHSDRFWIKESLSTEETMSFKETCMKFYRDKTYERVELFYKNFDCKDGIEAINGKAMPSLASLLNSIDWNWLANGLPGRFHGDFHFENILWSSSDQQFVFLDWRQDFGGDLSTGDIYYDFAKLLHGLIISHELIAGDFFRVDWHSESVVFDFHRKQILVECERHFGAWLENHRYDRKKVWVLTALIYLNIAALHHHPYSLLLYALGKSMLKSELENK